MLWLEALGWPGINAQILACTICAVLALLS